MSTTPEYIIRTCSNCKEKRLFQQKEVKKGKPSSLTMIMRRKKRRGKRGNLGKWSEPPAKGPKKAKKPNILLTCLTCKLRKNRGGLPRCIKFQIIKGKGQ